MTRAILVPRSTGRPCGNCGRSSDLGGINRLYAVALDRLSRSMRDAVVLLDELDKAGAELQLVHQAELTSGPHNRPLQMPLDSGRSGTV